ncbi:MAG: hypothetical protein NVS3B10_13430 [Polyangiales bacterium]
MASLLELPWNEHGDLAARPVWTPTASSPPPPAPPALALPPPRWGEGPIPVTERGAPVVTTALTEFALCPRRYRLLHLVGLGESAPWVPKLPSLEPAAAASVGPQLGLFAPTLVPVDASAGADGDLESDPALDVDAFDPKPTGDDDDAALPVTPPPLDPRARGIVAHLALERAPIPEATGEGADAYARAFLRGEGFDPRTEPGRALAERIARFLASPYARSLGAPDVDVQREVPFLVDLPSGAALRGTIDLLVVRRDRPRPRVEIVDYKLRAGSATDLGRYALQLRAYVAAVALSASLAGAEIVAGVAFLGRGDGQPLWLDDGADLSGSAAVARIDEVARGLLRARATGVWSGVDKKRCQAMGCGFRKLCWPPRRDGVAAADLARGRG